jgi:hypothetical protein
MMDGRNELMDALFLLFSWSLPADESVGKSCEMCFLVFCFFFFGHEDYGMPFSADPSRLESCWFVAADVPVVVCLVVLSSSFNQLTRSV